MQTNEIGVRTPQIGDLPDVPGDFARNTADLSLKVVPTFSTDTARDTAFAKIPFQVCKVANVLYLRKGATWDNVLTSTDINTPWLPATMQGTWSALVSAPAQYRISAGMVQWRGVAYRSDDVPGSSGMITVPSNAIPASANTGTTWQQNVHTKKVVAASIENNNQFQDVVLNLRRNGSLTCIVPGGTNAGIKLVPLWDLQWAL